MHEPGTPRLLTKRHPIVLVRNFLALQFAAAGVYTLAGALAHFAQIWRGLPYLSAVPFTIAQALFIFLVEAALVLVIFASWYREQLAVYDGRVVRTSGMLWRTERRFDVPAGATIAHRQNLLGRLMRYGTISVEGGAVTTKVRHVPDGARFVQALRGAAGALGRVSPDQLLGEAEHEGLEFKGSLRWDARTGKVNRALEKAALKTIAAFMNSRGGHLVLGVADDRTVRGLSDDIVTLQNKSRDGFEIHVGNLFNGMIGGHLRGCMDIRWSERDGEPFCVVSVAPAAEPAYVRSDNEEAFYVRTGNGTTALTVSQVPAYLKRRFPSHD